MKRGEISISPLEIGDGEQLIMKAAPLHVFSHVDNASLVRLQQFEAMYLLEILHRLLFYLRQFASAGNRLHG